jgi:hypothetical protein
MVFVELGHEAGIRPHDRSFRPDRDECLVRCHLTSSDKVGYHHSRTPADTHGTVDLLSFARREWLRTLCRQTRDTYHNAVAWALRERAANEGCGGREVRQDIHAVVVGY